VITAGTKWLVPDDIRRQIEGWYDGASGDA